MPGSSKQKISVFDFDRTLTKYHSYNKFSLRAHNSLGTHTHLDEQYESGKLIGSPDAWAKDNLHDVLHHDDTNDLSCIATFHNNPSFIAGFLATHFKRELHYQETLFSGSWPFAIAVYHLEGVERPLLISYIPAVGAAFNAIAQPLQTYEGEAYGKNPQIAHLMEVVAQRQLVTFWPDTIHFYDDSLLNVKNASLLRDLTVYLVSTAVTDSLVYDRYYPDLQASPVASSSNQPDPCPAASSSSTAQADPFRFFAEERKVADVEGIGEGMAHDKARRHSF